VDTLADRIARDGPVSELDAIGWAIRLAKRIETLHTLGVSHGSVSPACVLTEGRDRNARAFLADVQRTKSSLLFQSPERVQGGDLSAADDVWALGVTLYALLTGQNPFTGANDAEVRQKIVAASPSPLAVFDIGDDDLQHIIDRVFARELANRTASAVAFRRSLEEWHPDRGVAKLPPLEDEDDDDDDNARTMLVTDSSYLREKASQALREAPLASQGKLPSVGTTDLEEDARTVMRSFPQGGAAALFPRAAPAPAAGAPKAPVAKAENAKPAAPVVTPKPAPRPVSVPRPGPISVPRPASKSPPKPTAVMQHPVPIATPKPPAAQALREAPLASQALREAPLASPAPAVAPLPRLIEEESSDDNVRTVMRDPEQMQALSESASRVPHGPLGVAASLKEQPSASAEPTRPFARPFDDDNAPAATLFLSSDDNEPAPTMALAEASIRGAPLTSQALRGAPLGMDRPASLVTPHGTQQIPPGMVPLAPGPQRPAPQATVPLSSYLQDQAQIAMRSPPAAPQPVGFAPPAAAPVPMMQPPSSQPVESAGPSKGKLFLFALVALVVAATATFAILKLNGL
jgi:hypothetical protein